jgi:hypothetical protein
MLCIVLGIIIVVSSVVVKYEYGSIKHEALKEGTSRCHAASIGYKQLP